MYWKYYVCCFYSLFLSSVVALTRLISFYLRCCVRDKRVKRSYISVISSSSTLRRISARDRLGYITFKSFLTLQIKIDSLGSERLKRTTTTNISNTSIDRFKRNSFIVKILCSNAVQSGSCFHLNDNCTYTIDTVIRFAFCWQRRIVINFVPVCIVI